jgi:hypothetical protein
MRVGDSSLRSIFDRAESESPVCLLVSTSVHLRSRRRLFTLAPMSIAGLSTVISL